MAAIFLLPSSGILNPFICFIGLCYIMPDPICIFFNFNHFGNYKGYLLINVKKTQLESILYVNITCHNWVMNYIFLRMTMYWSIVFWAIPKVIVEWKNYGRAENFVCILTVCFRKHKKCEYLNKWSGNHIIP